MDPWPIRWAASLAARLGDAAQAREMAAKLRDRKPDCHEADTTYQRACIAAQLGEKREAMALLREAVAQGFGGWGWMHVDMGLEPLPGRPGVHGICSPQGLMR
jgi:hypothetical protein